MGDKRKMTDEEMADKYVSSQRYANIFNFGENTVDLSLLKRGVFLDGLKAGRPKWHKVADGDLPKDENDVLVYSGEDWRMCVGRYSPKYKAWETGCDTIAWCEIPKW